MDRKAVTSRFSSEEGQIWSYVLKIALIFIMIGFIISQCGPIALNYISVRTTADDAAELAVRVYDRSSGNMTKVYEEVDELLRDREARIDGNIVLVYDDGGRPAAISVPVRKIVNTFLFEKVGYLSPLTDACSVSEKSLY